MDEENKAILKISNESIKRLYYDYIKETYEETVIAWMINLRKPLAIHLVFLGAFVPWWLFSQ